MSRFDPTNEELRASLHWHASVTANLQSRVTEAKRHSRAKGDLKLERILDGIDAPFLDLADRTQDPQKVTTPTNQPETDEHEEMQG